MSQEEKRCSNIKYIKLKLFFFLCFLSASSFLHHPHSLRHSWLPLCFQPRVWRIPSPCLRHLGCLCYTAISTVRVCKLLPFPSCWWALLSCCHCGTCAGTMSSSFYRLLKKLREKLEKGLSLSLGYAKGSRRFPVSPGQILKTVLCLVLLNLPDSLSPQLLLHPLGNEYAQHLQGQPFGRPSLGIDPSPGTDPSPCWNQYKDVSDPGRSEFNALGCSWGGRCLESLAGAGGSKAWYREKNLRS